LQGRHPVEHTETRSVARDARRRSIEPPRDRLGLGDGDATRSFVAADPGGERRHELGKRDAVTVAGELRDGERERHGDQEDEGSGHGGGEGFHPATMILGGGAAYRQATIRRWTDDEVSAG
jgi:hypothetical protein